MTVETSLVVRMSGPLAQKVAGLRQQGEDALRRSSKLPPGDRSEDQRFEAVQAAIELCGLAALWAGEPNAAAPDGVGAAADWRSEGHEVVELRLPHATGETPLEGAVGTGPTPPAPRWQSASRSSAAAMRERFRALVAAALAPDATESPVLRPSGVTNSVLTETLREFVNRDGEHKAIAVPVRYRDGSEGPAFPLRTLVLAAECPPEWRRMRFTLLSIRHVEMDGIVDGAWLRNAKVSQRRAAGQTDQLAFETSLRQLRMITHAGPVVIEMYQTGLETAVIGFYRAVVQHLIEYPGTLGVIPRYFRGAARFEAGTPWVRG